jgi:branched-chain amino acid transport system permease protein
LRYSIEHGPEHKGIVPMSGTDQDRSTLVYQRWDERMKAALRSTISQDLIDEHGRNPRGRHSDALARLLIYFRRAPLTRKYVIICTITHAEWKIAELSAVRGNPPKISDETSFNSEAEAMHAVFLRRVASLMSA